MELITLGYLSGEELVRYREMLALKALAEEGHPGLSLERAVSAIIDYNASMASLRGRFEADHEALFYVNSYNGRVVEKV